MKHERALAAREATAQRQQVEDLGRRAPAGARPSNLTNSLTRRHYSEYLIYFNSLRVIAKSCFKLDIRLGSTGKQGNKGWQLERHGRFHSRGRSHKTHGTEKNCNPSMVFQQAITIFSAPSFPVSVMRQTWNASRHRQMQAHLQRREHGRPFIFS